MALKKPVSNGDYVKVKELFTAPAVLIDVIEKWSERNPHANPSDANQDRDCIRADITVFWNEKQLAGDEDPDVRENVVFGGGVPAARMAENTEPGDSIIVRFEQPAGKRYQSYTTYLDEAVLEAVESYYNKRDEERAASVPDFLS